MNKPKGLKLEHKNQKVLPFRNFIIRLGRYSLFAVGLIVFSIGIGMIGYHMLGHLNAVDSFHMASMILTGMGPVAAMESDSAKIFSAFYALYSGVAFLTVTAVFFAPIVHRILHSLQVEADGN